MKIIKTTLVAGLISLFATFSTFAEKVKIGDPGWTGATAIANLLAAVVIDKMGGEAELFQETILRSMVQLIEVKVKLKFTLISGYQINKLIQMI